MIYVMNVGNSAMKYEQLVMLFNILLVGSRHWRDLQPGPSRNKLLNPYQLALISL